MQKEKIKMFSGGEIMRKRKSKFYFKGLSGETETRNEMREKSVAKVKVRNFDSNMHMDNNKNGDETKNLNIRRNKVVYY